MATKAPLEQRPQDTESASPDELPEKIGNMIGAVLFAGICMLIAWPLIRHFL